MDRHAVSLKEINYLFPLYLYNPPINWDTQLLGTGQNGRRANLAPGFVARLGGVLGLQWVSDGRGDGRSTLGPEDVLAYIYAIFHAPSYRSRYAEFLKIDFPRVPLTDDAALFWELVERGRALIDCHLLKLGVLLADQPSPRGEIAAGYPKYQDGKVVINKAGEGFDDVPEEVWNFHIGGYQVAHKWLKDRKGRELSSLDSEHYRLVLVALEKTIEHMTRIDEIIASHGGWPLPGSQDASTPSDEDVRNFFGGRDATEVKPRPASQTNVGARRALPQTPQFPKPLAPSTPAKPQRTAGKARLAPTEVRSIAEYSRDDLIDALKKVVKRKWILREDAIRESARVLGFARTGSNIRDAFKSAINGAIRRGVLEYDGDWIRRTKS